MTVFCDCVLWMAPGTSCINSNVTLNVTWYSGLLLFEGRGQPYKRRLTSTRFGAVILRRRYSKPPVYTILMVQTILRPAAIRLQWAPPASFPVVLGDFRCDITCQACRESSPRTIALGSKPPLVTRKARTGLGTRLRGHQKKPAKTARRLRRH